VLEGHELLDVVSLQSEQLLVLVVVDGQHPVFLLLDLLLQEHVEGGGLHESESQVDGQNHVHDVDLLDHDTVWAEFSLH